MIAVIDDDAHARQAIARVLRSAGYAVAGYVSGIEFLQSLRHCRPACAVLDLRMPLIDGFGVQEALARGAYNIPVILLTADLTDENIARATKLGALRCLRKPVESDQLLEAVGKACAKTQ